MQITILCKVVDNFGDIGVVYRLAKQLKTINPENQINLVVDNLSSFQKICSSVNINAERQELEGLVVYDWKAEAFCHHEFSRNDGELMPVILECFQCGRPDWMERILFEEKLERTVHIIMIDYLTAEQYAEDFHCLQSLTRSAKVQKVNFMPGFTERTGGLVIEEAWREVPVRKADGPVLVFTYEKDWRELVEGLLKGGFDPSTRLRDRRLNHRRILVAQGRGKESFMSAVKACGADNLVEELPYLNQTEWDEVMKGCSALVIRGEESMSRACLSGIPFIWHAYPQSDEYQLVKVKALLERMRRHFEPSDFEIVERAWLEINSPSEKSLQRAQQQSNPYQAFFAAADRLAPGFYDFALSLRKNGDLAANLMTYIEKLAII
jgi:uncharacterized repeat protein (TIGR03837 family)